VAEALAAFGRGNVDLLLADIGLPEHDGYELIRRLRALEAPGRCTPAVALTAHARPEDRAHALAAGYARHIAKPFEPAEVLAAIAHLAGRTDTSISG
jgi:CheY-like chemotaxis protein